MDEDNKSTPSNIERI